MRYVVIFLIFAGVLTVLIANPAPVTVEPADGVLLGITLLTAIYGLSGLPTFTIGRAESAVMTAVALYFSSLLISALMGFINGVPVMMVMRSVVPYVLFIPLIFVGTLPKRLVSPGAVAGVFIVVGLLQIIYLNYLYLTQVPQIGTAMSVLRNRITFMDPRTTLPLMLSVPVLSLIISTDKCAGARKYLIQGVKGLLLLSGLWAGMITLTRAIFLSMMAGWAVYLPLYVFQASRSKSFSTTKFFLRLTIFILCLMGVILLVSQIPKVHLIETGLMARFHGTATGGGGDYSNGRIYDEWIPALTTWLQSGSLDMVFGIGAGNAFHVLSGEERTYIHNLTVYSIVYGGLYGFFATVYFYLTLFRVLVFRAMQTRQAVYTGMAALLFSLYCYGQLFAVHKGLAFNEMLFLIAAVALMDSRKNQYQ